MLQKFQKHIAENFSFLKDKKLLIAISGGMDSVVLTHLTVKLSSVKVSLAHCNFQLREKDSDLDAVFVENLGKKLDVKVFTTSFDTKKYSEENKLSTQVAARELRYNWFQKLIEKYNFDYVLTAHHADDNLETFLINLTRGTGLEGLTGIPAINGNIVRALLTFSREEIHQYAKENKIEWREDVSNAETKYLRNKIRHEVVPKLKEINTNLLHSFKKTAAFLSESKEIIEDRINNVKPLIVSKNEAVVTFKIDEILKLSNPKAYLHQLLKNYNFTEWNDVENLVTAQSGKQIFSKTHRLVKDRKFLLLTKIIDNNKMSSFKIEESKTEIKEPIALKLEIVTEKSSQKNNVIFVDKDLLNFPLTVRKWQKGDYFYPSKMKGKKKLSKYFKDEKLSILEKENIWLLCNSKNEVIWVVGKRQDNRFMTTKSTKNILKIKH